jgi:hypothetical protein
VTLLDREAAADDLGEALTLSSARTDTVSLPLTAPPPFDATVERPLSDFQSDLVAAAAALLEEYGTPLPYRWTELTTTEAATRELDDRIEGLRALHTPSAPPPPAGVTPTFTA